MPSNPVDEYAKRAARIQEEVAKLNQIADTLGEIFKPLTKETKQKLRSYPYRENDRIREASFKLSNDKLRPQQREVLVRLMRSEGMWVSAEALGYINNFSQYDDTHNMTIDNRQLTATMSKIKAYVKDHYVVESRRTGRFTSHFRLVPTAS